MNPKDHKPLTRATEFRFILLVRDLATQRLFYENIFGWAVVNDWGGGILYDTGAAIFELIEDPQANKPNGSCRLAISVPDVWSLFERLKNRVTIVFPLRDNSWGDTSFRISDPDGFPITLFSPRE